MDVDRGREARTFCLSESVDPLRTGHSTRVAVALYVVGAIVVVIRRNPVVIPLYGVITQCFIFRRPASLQSANPFPMGLSIADPFTLSTLSRVVDPLSRRSRPVDAADWRPRKQATWRLGRGMGVRLGVPWILKGVYGVRVSHYLLPIVPRHWQATLPRYDWVLCFVSYGQCQIPVLRRARRPVTTF
jgi:hypothetical protein